MTCALLFLMTRAKVERIFSTISWITETWTANEHGAFHISFLSTFCVEVHVQLATLAISSHLESPPECRSRFDLRASSRSAISRRAPGHRLQFNIQFVIPFDLISDFSLLATPIDLCK